MKSPPSRQDGALHLAGTILMVAVMLYIAARLIAAVLLVLVVMFVVVLVGWVGYATYRLWRSHW